MQIADDNAPKDLNIRLCVAACSLVFAVILSAFPLCFAAVRYYEEESTGILFSNPPPYELFSLIYAIVSLLLVVDFAVPFRNSNRIHIARLAVCLACLLLNVLSLPLLPGIPRWFQDYSTFLYFCGIALPVLILLLLLWMLIMNIRSWKG
jgi:hypothetical protein